MNEMEILLGMNEKERDLYFLRMAFQVAKNFSQDANTQTGAVVVDPNFRVVSFGANRARFGDPQRYEGRGERLIFDRPDKYVVLDHAEPDAHFVANRAGNSLMGMTLYTTWTPCAPCAKVTTGNGVKRYVTHQACTDWYSAANRRKKERIDWMKSIKEAVGIFNRSSVEYICLSEPIGGVEILFDDQMRRL